MCTDTVAGILECEIWEVGQTMTRTRFVGRLRGRDDGAAAVEMALVMPLLLFVLFGIVDLSRAYDTQIQLSQAAREGARLVSMQSTSDLTTRIHQAAPSLCPTPETTPVPTCTVTTEYLVAATGLTWAGDCTTAGAAGAVNTQVTVTTKFNWITGIAAMAKFFGPAVFPTPTQQSATGVMQCG
jgi:Flp pilus assembly protein TadG